MAELKRDINLTLLMLYGLGTILGAGIYVLTGVVAKHAGDQTPLAFFLAAIVAAPTAYTFGVLSSRYPRSAGPAAYVHAAFKRQWLASITGAFVVLVGIVSAATIARGFVGYLQVFITVPDAWVIALLVCALTAIAIYGIVESVTAAAVITLIEILGLLLVIYGGLSFESPRSVDLLPDTGMINWSGVLAGTFLAFYAFIGFEDIVTMAEETRSPEKNVPYAILGALLIATLLYFLVTYLAIRTVPLNVLANHDAPMSLIVEQHGLFSPKLLAAISMLAVVNGVLVQIIMASRVIYGVARMYKDSHPLGHVWQSTRTPGNATLLTGTVILVLALLLDVEALASITSIITLLIFTVINLALCRIQGTPKSPLMLIPWFGMVLCLALLVASIG